MTTSHPWRLFTAGILAVGLIAAATTVASAKDKLDRTALPIQAPKHKAITEVDARKAKAPPRFEVKAPKEAPNVVIVLIDDIGFGTATSFGGDIRTPTLDRLGKQGLRYNQFHHYGAMFSYPYGYTDWPQSPFSQRRFSDGSSNRIPRQ
jgi:hypothetical protein